MAGIIAPRALAGYRNDAVYLRTSRYVPPRWEAVRDAMPALFDLLEQETEPAYALSSDIGCSGISMLIPTATGAWRGS